MVVVSSTFSAPAEGIILQTPATKLVVNDQELGTATLYITENNVVWGGGVAAAGGSSPVVSLLYPSISLHAIQRDPSPALYMVLNYELKFLQKARPYLPIVKQVLAIAQLVMIVSVKQAVTGLIPPAWETCDMLVLGLWVSVMPYLYTKSAVYDTKSSIVGLPEMNQESGGGDTNDDDDDDFDADNHPITQLRFIPQNEGDLQAMYSAMSQGQALHPDANDDIDDDPYMDGEEFEEGDDEFEDAEETNGTPEEAAARLRQMRLENGAHYEDCEDAEIEEE